MSESKKYLCGHRDQLLGRSTFYSHRRLYYDVKSRQWSRTKLFYVPDNPAAHIPSLSIEKSGTDPAAPMDAEPMFCEELISGEDGAFYFGDTEG